MSTNEAMSIHRKGYWPELWIELYRYSMVWRLMDTRPAWDKGFPPDSEELREMVRMMKADARAENRTASIGATEMCVRLMSKNLCVCGKHTARGVVVPRAATKLEELRGAYPVCSRCVPDVDFSHSFEVRDKGAGETPDDDGANVEGGSPAAYHRSDSPRRHGDDRNAVGYAKPAQPVAAKTMTLDERMAARAEAMARNRAREVAARINEEKSRLAEIDAKRFRARLDSACYQAGTTAAWITERCRSGNLKRGGDRIAKRNAVFHILRQMGMSYPEIGEVCGINCSTVQTNMRDNTVPTFDSTEEAA